MSEQLYRVVRGMKWHKRVLCRGGIWARVRKYREVEGYELHLTAAEAVAIVAHAHRECTVEEVA